jgi:hypothetical protein
MRVSGASAPKRARQSNSSHMGNSTSTATQISASQPADNPRAAFSSWLASPTSARARR